MTIQKKKYEGFEVAVEGFEVEVRNEKRRCYIIYEKVYVC